MFQKLENLYSKCFSENSQKWSASDFADVKKSGAEIIVGENSFIVYHPVADECEIILIGVTPEMRRTGTATALMTIVEKDIKNQGVNKIFLDVSSTNNPAIQLYKKLGYKQIGTRQKYYQDGSDAIMMVKELYQFASRTKSKTRPSKITSRGRSGVAI